MESDAYPAESMQRLRDQLAEAGSYPEKQRIMAAMRTHPDFMASRRIPVTEADIANVLAQSRARLTDLQSALVSANIEPSIIQDCIDQAMAASTLDELHQSRQRMADLLLHHGKYTSHVDTAL
jgi:hypothetical protein